MKYAHKRQHTQKAKPIRKDGSKYIVMDEGHPDSERLSVYAAKRLYRQRKQENAS